MSTIPGVRVEPNYSYNPVFFNRVYLEWDTADFMCKIRSTEHMAFASALKIDLFRVPVTISPRVILKRCLRCDDHLPRSQFSPKKDAADGLHSYCKECRNELARVKWKAKRLIS